MQLLQALASPRKREILRLIWRGERTAGDICRGLEDVTPGAVSQHLASLEAIGLVSRRSEGRNRYYRARQEALGPLSAWLESMWSHSLSELKRRAEIEEARRGPRPARKRTRRKP